MLLISTPVKDKTLILGDKNIQSKPVLRIFFRKSCIKRVFGFQQKGSLLFLFITIAEVKSVEYKQC